MKKLMAVITGLFVLGLTGLAQADFVGNKASKFFFPDSCSYVKLIKKENTVTFKTSAEAQAAGYKPSSKCKADVPDTAVFTGNKSSKLFFPADCSYAKLIKDENKVPFTDAKSALAAGYKLSSKCSDSK